MILKSWIFTLFLFGFTKNLFCVGAENVDWICEGTSPCLRVSNPPGGVGVVSPNTPSYRIVIMVHRRKNEPQIRDWWAKKRDPTWNVVINWFRLLDSKARVPLTSCKNNLACTVSLMGEKSWQNLGEDGRFSYRHFLVEVKFEGHPSTSSAEIILRKHTGNGEMAVRPQQIRPMHLKSTAGIPVADAAFRDYRSQNANSDSDYEDQEQYQQERRGNSDAIRMGHHLRILPKAMVPDLSNYPAEDKYQSNRKYDDRDLSSSELNDEPVADAGFNNWDDLVIPQNLYEDELFLEDDSYNFPGVEAAGWIFLVFAILLLLFLCYCYRKGIKKKIKKLRKWFGQKRRIKKAVDNDSHLHHQERHSRKEPLAQRFMNRLNKKGPPYPRSGNVMSKDGSYCSYSRLSLSSSCSEEEDELFNLLPSRSKTDESWRDVREKTKNLENQAKLTFMASARKVSSLSAAIPRRFSKTTGYCYKMMLAIRRCFEPIGWCMKQYCNPCYAILYNCFSAIGSFLYRCCVTTSESEEYTKANAASSSDDILQLPPDKTHKSKNKPRKSKNVDELASSKKPRKKSRHSHNDYKFASDEVPKRKKRASNDKYKFASSDIFKHRDSLDVFTHASSDYPKRKHRSTVDDYKLASSDDPKRKHSDTLDDFKLASSEDPKRKHRSTVDDFKFASSDYPERKHRSTVDDYKLASSDDPKRKHRSTVDDFKFASNDDPKRKHRSTVDDFKLASNDYPKRKHRSTVDDYKLASNDYPKRKHRSTVDDFKLAPGDTPKHKARDSFPDYKYASRGSTKKNKRDSIDYEMPPSHKHSRHYDDYVLAPKRSSIERKSHYSDDDFELVPTYQPNPSPPLKSSDDNFREARIRKSKRKDADEFFPTRKSNRRSSFRRPSDEFQLAAIDPSEGKYHTAHNKVAFRTLYRNHALARKNSSGFQLTPSSHPLTENPWKSEHDELVSTPQQHHRLCKDIPYPSCGVVIPSQPSFTPKHDISGRFFIPQLSSRRRYSSVQRYEKVTACNDVPSTSRNLPQSMFTPGPSCIHLPQQNCGLHCIQTQHNQCTSTEYSDVRSISETAAASSRKSSNEVSENLNNQQNSLNLGEGSSCSTEYPPLPRALWRTKEGFRRENQRIDALMKRLEKKSPSCIVIDETSSQENGSKGRLFKIKNKRMASAKERFASINFSEDETKYLFNQSSYTSRTTATTPHTSRSTSICPPRLLYRRPRLPKRTTPSIDGEKNGCVNGTDKLEMIDETTKEKRNSRSRSASSLDESFHPSTICSTSSRKSSDDTLGSIHTSEINEVISDGSVSFPTSKMELTTSNDESSMLQDRSEKSELPQAALKPSCCPEGETTLSDDDRLSPTTCDLGKDLLLDSSSKTHEGSNCSGQSATELLQLAANAFFTSDNEVSTNDEYYEEFWPNG